MPKRPTPPVVQLGTMTFGAQVSEAEAKRMLGRFLDAGHSWVDTAYIYTDGRSEGILGRYLKGAKRQRVHLATKVYPNEPGTSARRGLRPELLREKFETSLKRLQTDYVDLFYLHAPDNATPLEKTLAECQAFHEEGKIRALGLSNYPAWQAAEAALICRGNGWVAPSVYQGMYNAVTLAVETECLPACRHFGLRFVAYNPLAGGFLTGKHRDIAAVPADGRFAREYYRNRFWNRSYFAALDRLVAAAERQCIALAEASLRWLMHHSRTDGVLLGASRLRHLVENLAACAQGPLPPAMVRAFSAAWDIARPQCQRYFRD